MMVYDPARAYWEQPPPWKIAASLGVSVAISFAFYQWWQQKYSARRPLTLTPAWEVASWLRSWNKEREAGDPIILNPLRCSAGCHLLPAPQPWTSHLAMQWDVTPYGIM